jgi:hypothetical protein
VNVETVSKLLNNKDENQSIRIELINKTEKFSESLSNLVKPLKLEANLKIQVGFFL